MLAASWFVCRWCVSRSPKAMRASRNSLPHKAGGHRFQRVWGSGDMPLSTTMTGLLKGMFIDSPP
jgi:hypothetical protein